MEKPSRTGCVHCDSLASVFKGTIHVLRDGTEVPCTNPAMQEKKLGWKLVTLGCIWAIFWGLVAGYFGIR